MKICRRFTAMLLMGVMLLAALTGCGSASATLNSKNIVEALNDYAARREWDDITFVEGKDTKVDQVAKYMETHPALPGDMEDEDWENVAETCGLDDMASDDTGYAVSVVPLNTKLKNKDNKLAYCAADLYDGLWELYNERSSDLCHIMTYSGELTGEGPVKVSVAQAKVEVNGETCPMLVVLYELRMDLYTPGHK